jgi:hypothetical protein
MYKKIITISAYDRISYLEQTLLHLSKCYGIQDYKLYCFIDPSTKQNEAVDILFKYGLNISYHINERRLDCNGNIYRCMDFGFQYSDYVIHIEDDIILARDALLYFEHCRLYQDDRSIFSICGYNRYNRRDYKPKGRNTIFRQRWFDPWSWATWKNRWEEEIKDNWQFGYGPRFKDGKMVHEGGGWDVNMGTIIRDDQRRINPNLSRAKNIGEYGRHTPSVEYHKKTHAIIHWSNDYEFDPNIRFIETEAEVEHD